MSCWFETIIEKVTPETKKPIVVLDEQKYLELSEFQARLRQDGYEIVFAEPGIQVRMKYELEVKGRDKTMLVVTGNYVLVDDMRESAFVVELRPKEIFRNFDEKALAGLRYNELSAIDAIHLYEELSYERTVIFLLETLYGVDFRAWQKNKSKERCLAILLSVFSNTEKPNKAIADFLQSLAKPYFDTAVKDFSDTNKFMSFLKGLKPSEINWENPMLAKELAAIKINGSLKNNDVFCQEKNRRKFFDELFEYLKTRIKTIGVQYKDWFELAPKIGELGCAAYEIKDAELYSKYDELISHINDSFQSFVDNSYDTLFSMSGVRHPITIAKVQDYMAATAKNRKIAFIVIDGMSYWQWTVLKHKLEKLGLKVEDKPTLSWLPSITAWARQSIFAGQKPDLSVDNRNEGELFKKYWLEKQRKLAYQVSYEYIKTEQKISVPSQDITVASFVTNGLDDLMHGNILGYEQLFANTNLWIDKSEICESVKDLRDAGFAVFISTDHGNVEAELNLKISVGQKSLIHSKSKRFAQFDTEEQAKNFIEKNKSYWLGRKDKTVYFKDTNGFGSSQTKVITHGGSHVLELLIPVGVVK